MHTQYCVGVRKYFRRISNDGKKKKRKTKEKIDFYGEYFLQTEKIFRFHHFKLPYSFSCIFLFLLHLVNVSSCYLNSAAVACCGLYCALLPDQTSQMKDKLAVHFYQSTLWVIPVTNKSSPNSVTHWFYYISKSVSSNVMKISLRLKLHHFFKFSNDESPETVILSGTPSLLLLPLRHYFFRKWRLTRKIK